jgi:enoyl-[acyl-carrier protein] reductase II
MGTRMLSALESPVHDNYKRAIVAAAETDTVVINRYARPAMRVLRTQRTSALERAEPFPMGELNHILKLYFGGDMVAAVGLCGQVAGRIRGVEPVASIVREAWDGARQILGERARQFAS